MMTATHNENNIHSDSFMFNSPLNKGNITRCNNEKPPRCREGHKEAAQCLRSHSATMVNMLPLGQGIVLVYIWQARNEPRNTGHPMHSPQQVM